jgi:hypothetical protein
MSAYFAFFLAGFAGGAAAWSGAAFSSLAADAVVGASFAAATFVAGDFFGAPFLVIAGTAWASAVRSTTLRGRP